MQKDTQTVNVPLMMKRTSLIDTTAIIGAIGEKITVLYGKAANMSGGPSRLTSQDQGRHKPKEEFITTIDQAVGNDPPHPNLNVMTV